MIAGPVTDSEERLMKIEQWKITDVKPYERNPRVNDAAERERS